MKWWELLKWNKIKANKTWFSVLLRRKPFLIDKDNLKSMKRSSLENSLNHNKIELIISKQWKKLLNVKEKPFSKSSNKKKPREDKHLKALSKWETISTLKSKRKKLDDKKWQTTTKSKIKKKSSKLPRITNSNLRPKDLQKKREWKTNSRLKWLRNSLKMNVWSKWTHRREEWENNNTRETSKIYGNKNSRCIELKENKNGMKELRKNKRNPIRDKLSKPRKLSF